MKPGNGVCQLVQRVNRLIGFSADNSYQRHAGCGGVVVL